MKDTTPEIEFRFNQMLMKKSGQERLKIGFSMFEMARRQVVASIMNRNPDSDPRQIRKSLFLRFYGEDFTPEECEKILAQL